MNEQYLSHALAYRCPGCSAKLAAGNAALAHMNRCTALRGMIANGGGYAIKNTATGRQKAASNDAKPIPEKAGRTACRLESTRPGSVRFPRKRRSG